MSARGESAEQTGHPAPPWRLSGPVLLALAPVPLPAARRHLPDGVRALALAPGRTLAGLLLASYDAHSTLPYNELIALAAIARRGRRVGMWVSHAYVDDAVSLTGGREIWGMPKQKADFRLQERPGTGRAEVRQGGALLARLRVRPPRVRLPQPLIAPVLSGSGQEWLFTLGRGLGAIGPVRVRIDIPPQSPLAELALPNRAVGVAGAARRFVMPPPAPIR